MRADERLLRQPRCFAYLLRFYDGICQWEEGANTPVLHIGWARPLVNTISKFDASIRAQVIIECHEMEPMLGKYDDASGSRREINSDDGFHNNNDTTSNNNNTTNNNNNINNNNNNNNNCYKTKERSSTARDLIASLESKVPSNPAPMHPGIQALTAACSEKILNRDYLLQGGGEPFVAPQDNSLPPTPSTSQECLDSEIEIDLENESPRIILYSEKMKGLKDLLLAEKLNTHAISLQLTAQSQVQIGKKTRGNDEIGVHQRPKRTRRE